MRVFNNKEDSSLDGQQISATFIAGTTLLLAFLWGLDYFIIRTPILTPFYDLSALTPIYAFWKPIIRPQALWFIITAAIFVKTSRFALQIEKVNSLSFAIYLFVSFCTLAGTVFLIRNDSLHIAQNLAIYPKEEVLYDARHISSINDFIRNYKTLQPQLSMRGQHYPPGGATFLHITALIFGAELWKVGAVILLLAGAGVTLCYSAMRNIVSELQARQSVLILSASPALLNYTCTSMDAAFFFLASLCLSSAIMVGMRQVNELPHRPAISYSALLTGILLYFACFVSFAAFTVGLCLGLFIAFNSKYNIKERTILLASIATGFLSTYLLFKLSFQYSLLENLSYAREHNFQFMSDVLNAPASNFYFYACYGNITAFIIGCGIAVTGAVISSLKKAYFRWTPWRIASVITLLVMTMGGMFIMETERIWLFAIPWMTLFAVSSSHFNISSLRLLITGGLIQAFIMEIFLFTLW